MGAAAVVVVSREANGWQANVPAHRVVNARGLQALDRRVRLLLAGAALTYRFHTGNTELDRLIRRIGIARGVVRRYQDRTRELTDQVVMVPSGLSQRDLGVLLGLSHQRIYQLVERQRLLAERRKAGEPANGRPARLFLVSGEGRS
jgi:hypothetical protein